MKYVRIYEFKGGEKVPIRIGVLAIDDSSYQMEGHSCLKIVSFSKETPIWKQIVKHDILWNSFKILTGKA